MKVIVFMLVLAMAFSGCNFIKTPASGSTPSSSASSSESKSSGTDNDVMTGSFVGKTYHNSYFGLSFTVPDGWTIASKEQIDQIFNAAMSAIGTDEDEQDSDSSTQQVLYLAVAAKYDFGYSPNPNVNLGAENLKGLENTVRTPSDYLQIVKSQIAQAGEGYTCSDISTMTYSGADFASLSMQMEYEGQTTQQTQICTIKNGYALIFTFTYYTDDELDEMSNIADTIQMS